MRTIFDSAHGYESRDLMQKSGPVESLSVETAARDGMVFILKLSGVCFISDHSE